MPSPWLATTLDQEQFEFVGTKIASRTTAVETMPDRAGTDVAEELGYRYLLRYLTDAQVTSFTGGSTDRPHWVTPTPVGPEDVVAWLALFAPKEARGHVLLLDAAEIDVVRGPAWIRLGQGLEFYLPGGFPADAVVDVGVVVVR